MWTIYEGCFALTLVMYIFAIVYTSRKKWSDAQTPLHSVATTTPSFKSFQRQFLLVYLLAMAADWMQGPYIYRLYTHYGYDRHENGILFITGFGSSLVFGTWVGPLADTWGRRRACALYSVVYALSCATKHFNHFGVLVAGRFLGGIATSLLWSVFESWMVSEHYTRGFDPAWIGETFSLMSTGNGVVAVLSGVVAQCAADAFGHPVAPFDVSAILLFACFVIVRMRWTENYGSARTPLWEQMRDAAAAVRRDSRVAFTGAQQALFESGMYVFVFLWTPALEADGDVPHGLVFACFMLAASLCGMLFGLQTDRVVAWMPAVYLCAAATMLLLCVPAAGLSKMVALILFEIIVGFFWPCIATLRAVYVPEEYRASVMNIFRAPLNCIVCCILYFQGQMPLQRLFFLAALLHVSAAVSASLLKARVRRHTSAV